MNKVRRPRRASSVASKDVGQIFLANEVRFLENAYPVEMRGDVPFSWTGPGIRTSFFVAVERDRAMSFEIECDNGISPFNWHNMFYECEGVLKLCSYREDGDLKFLGGDIPSRKDTHGVVIRLHLQETLPPSSVSTSNSDPRPMGISIQKLHFQAATA